MAEFVTDASGATCWPNLEPMVVSFSLLAEEITQVKEAMPWVRCASGNVYQIDPGEHEFYVGVERGTDRLAVSCLQVLLSHIHGQR